MDLGEKVSYLRGMLEGMEIDTSRKECKFLVKLADVMQEMADYIEDLEGQVDELTELCDILDSDLGDLEEEVYSLGGCDCGCEDDDEYDFGFDDSDDDDSTFYEVNCPACGNTFFIDEDDFSDGCHIDCPACGEFIAFDIDDPQFEKSASKIELVRSEHDDDYEDGSDNDDDFHF